MSSRLVLGYYSTLVFESIGLNVPSLFFYYDNYKYEIFDYAKSENDILILDDSYKAFEDSVLKKLIDDNPLEYFKKYKHIYMNQDQDMINTISKKIGAFL